MDPYIAAVLPVAGVVLGATLQFLFSRRTSETTHFLGLRTQAYVDFVKATSALTFSQRAKIEDKERDATAQLTEAKARICIYGDSMVVDALAEFWRGGAVLDSPERYKSFVRICQAMRKCGMMSTQPVQDKQIAQLLIGTDV